MRADLYTLALMTALEEEHPLRLAQPEPGTITVEGMVFGIYTAETPDIPVFDLPAPVADGEGPETTLDAVIADAANALQGGVEMIVVNRALIAPLRDLLDPPPPEPPQYKTLFTAREFMELFPVEVKRAIFTAAESDVDLRITLQMMSAGAVSVKSAETIDTLGGLLTAGLITQSLHDDILQGQLLSA